MQSRDRLLSASVLVAVVSSGLLATFVGAGISQLATTDEGRVSAAAHRAAAEVVVPAGSSTQGVRDRTHRKLPAASPTSSELPTPWGAVVPHPMPAPSQPTVATSTAPTGGTRPSSTVTGSRTAAATSPTVSPTPTRGNGNGKAKGSGKGKGGGGGTSGNGGNPHKP